MCLLLPFVLWLVGESPHHLVIPLGFAALLIPFAALLLARVARRSAANPREDRVAQVAFVLGTIEAGLIAAVLPALLLVV